MSILLWIVSYLLEMAFWVWVAFRGGAGWLEDNWLASLLIHAGASNWSRDSIELVAWFMMLSSTVWFLVGLFDPNLRFQKILS